jgi:Raf kinase inhibitor-like YbhB/YbcL family protein
MSLVLESPSFRAGETIPSKYTCDGENISPPLAWSGVPEETKSFALIVDDPDAPAGVWVHWVVYGIPAVTGEIVEKASSARKLPSGALEGTNDFRRTSYGGPCPPSGTHRYSFRLYALDSASNLPSGASKKQVMDFMKGRILAQAELVGKYSRRR